MALPDSPQTREEEYLAHAATGDGTIPEYPVTREEQYLNKIATGGGAVPDTPLTRKEMYLAEIAANGSGGETVLINNKNISANGEYSASSDDADGYKKVTVAVPNTYAAADEGKVVSNGALAAQTAHEQVTQNGTVDTTLNNSVEVAVPLPSGSLSITQNDTYDVTQYASAVVNVPGVDPTAQKMNVNVTDSGKTLLIGGQEWMDRCFVYDGWFTKADVDSSVAVLNGVPNQMSALATVTGCAGVTEIKANSFYSLSKLEGSISLPSLQSMTGTAGGWFRNCSKIETVQLGSVGHSLSTIQSQVTMVFQNCTQANLTITVYTTGDNVDTFLTKIRNGATNATIIFKAAEATTYGGNSFAAGGTILTSTP